VRELSSLPDCRIKFLHRHISDSAKTLTQLGFEAGRVDNLVSTITFGLGLDYALILVHHLLLELVQRMGRAGRQRQSTTYFTFLVAQQLGGGRCKFFPGYFLLQSCTFTVSGTDSIAILQCSLLRQVPSM
jgi:hypothetical protein